MTLPQASPGTPLYVHLPFCAAKCTYCDFYSLPAEGEDLAGTLATLERELSARAPREPRTVFLGGGTPSLYGTRELVGFLDRLDARTGFRSSAEEVTVECNPESLDARKVAALLEAGVTRLSIGVQSLRAHVLELFGRVHDTDQALRAIAAAREGGCENLSVDVIYAVPGQRAAEWEEDLERVLALGLEHLSAYNLTLEPGTPLEAARRAGDLVPLDEDTELEMFGATRRLTRAAGLEAYEISNFARPGRECRHNLAYWANAEYVGCGPSAVSKIGRERFANPRSVTRWRTALDAGTQTVASREELSDRARLGETWWLGLRTAEGVDPRAARRAAEVAGVWGEDDDPALAIAERLTEQGLLVREAGRYRLSERGLPLADAVAREFLA